MNAVSGIGFDWQFVIVTLAALWGAWILLRPLLPARKAKAASEETGACARCSAGNPCASKGGVRESSGLVTLGGGSRRAEEKG